MSDSFFNAAQIALFVLALLGLLGVLYSAGKPGVTKLERVCLVLLVGAGALGIMLGASSS